MAVVVHQEIAGDLAQDGMARQPDGVGGGVQAVQQARKIGNAVGGGAAAHDGGRVIGAIVIVALGAIENPVRGMKGAKVEEQVFADPEGFIEAQVFAVDHVGGIEFVPDHAVVLEEIGRASCRERV